MTAHVIVKNRHEIGAAAGSNVLRLRGGMHARTGTGMVSRLCTSANARRHGGLIQEVIEPKPCGHICDHTVIAVSTRQVSTCNSSVHLI
jgi:hypothetical protein